jgi:uncharacterized membrane protein YraQ (UPF0718 family)
LEIYWQRCWELSLPSVRAPRCRFIGIVENGIHLGVAFSLLVAAPTITEVTIVLKFGLFGWKVTMAIIATGYLFNLVL